MPPLKKTLYALAAGLAAAAVALRRFRAADAIWLAFSELASASAATFAAANLFFVTRTFLTNGTFLTA